MPFSYYCEGRTCKYTKLDREKSDCVTLKGKKGNSTVRVMLVVGTEENLEIEKVILEETRGQWVTTCFLPTTDLLDKIEKQQPDLLFFSISYDGANGLGMMNQIRKAFPRLPICVCSAIHSQELVSQLMLKRVSAYLAMPIRKHQLQQVIATLMEQLTGKRMVEERELEAQKKITKLRKLLEQGFVYSILFGSKEKEQLRELCTTIGVESQGCIILVEWKQRFVEERQEEKVYQNIIDEMVAQLGEDQCIVGPRIFRRAIIYYGMKKETALHLEIKGISEMLNRIAKNIIDTSVVYVGNVQSVDEIYKSYQDAISQHDIKKEEKRIKYGKNEKYISHREYVSMSNQLIDAVKMGRDDAGRFLLELLAQMKDMEKETKINKVMQLLLLCCHSVYTDGENELDFMDCRTLLEEMEAAHNLDAWALQKMDYIVQAVKEHQYRNTSGAVKMAIDYIEQNYNREISLDDVAKYVGVTPQHFSKIFKQETGTNYVDWITELRLEQAKQLLIESKHTMKEICFLVGYKDPNYFSRIFKKMVGMPPRDFIRRQNSGLKK